jgi:hypothetical protein
MGGGNPQCEKMQELEARLRMDILGGTAKNWMGQDTSASW